MISLNAGSRSTHEWLAGADKYDLVISNIKNFFSIRERVGGNVKPKVVIQILETKKTESEIKEFKEFLELFIGPNDSIYVRPLLNWGGKIDTDDLCVHGKGKRYPCISLWVSVSIDKDGNVYPCCEGFSSRENSELLLGNIHEKTLIEIYSDNRIKKIREKHLNSQWNDIPECSRCDFWSFSQNIWFKFNKRWF